MAGHPVGGRVDLRVDQGGGGVPAGNYLRVPVVMSGAMFLVFFPLILGKGEANYMNDTGHGPPDFLGRWLLITALLFAGSAVAYAVRLRRTG